MSLSSFIGTMSPMHAVKARDALEMRVCVNGGQVMKRHELIELRVRHGAMIAELKNGESVLMNENGSFLDKRNATATGLKYAAFLLEHIHGS